MTNDELTTIRIMVNDTVEPYRHEDADIVVIYDVFNGDLYRAAHHLLLNDALSLEAPAVPSEPVLDDPPTFLSNMELQKWRESNQDKISVWQNQLSEYRAQVDLLRAKQDTLRQMAQSFVESGKGRQS